MSNSRGIFRNAILPFGKTREIARLRLLVEDRERRLAEVSAAYSSLAKLSSDVLLMIDPDSGKILEAEERAAELFDRDLNGLPELPAGDLFDSRERARWSRLLSRAGEGRPVSAESLMIARADMTERWADVRLATVPEQATPTLMMAIHDCTERQRQYALSQKHISFLHEMSGALPRFHSFEEVLGRLAGILAETLGIHAFTAVLPGAAGSCGYVFAGRAVPLSFITDVKKSIAGIANEMSDAGDKSTTSFTVSRRDDFPNTESSSVASQIMLPMAGTEGVAGVFSGSPDTFGKEDLSMLSTTLNTLSALYLAFQAYQEVERLSVTDSLTGLFNRRKFYEEFSREWERARRYGSRLSLIMMDLDHFKKVNDTYGHQTGDEVLKSTAEVLSYSVRKTDVVARYGGEEFIILLTETGPEGAGEVAERIRKRIAKTSLSEQTPDLRCTASLGVTTFRSNASMDTLVGEADEALYNAKRLGRDRVSFYGALAEAFTKNLG